MASCIAGRFFDTARGDFYDLSRERVTIMATKLNDSGLNSKQRKLAEMLANPAFAGTITELCNKCDVTRATFYRWMDKPEFKEYLDSLISRFADSELSTVWKALVRRCAIGDVQAMKLYFELRKDLSNKEEGGVQIVDDI